MKKRYITPELNIKAYAQFENVFTACSKGNAHSINKKTGLPCMPDVYEHPSDDPSNSAAFKTHGSL